MVHPFARNFKTMLACLLATVVSGYAALATTMTESTGTMDINEPPSGCVVFLVTGPDPKYGQQLEMTLYFTAKNLLARHRRQAVPVAPSVDDPTLRAIRESMATRATQQSNGSDGIGGSSATAASIGPFEAAPSTPVQAQVTSGDRADDSETPPTYPVFIFHDDHLTSRQSERLRRYAIAGMIAGSNGADATVDLHFVRVEIGLPRWLLNDPNFDPQIYQFECRPYPPFPLRYLQMNRFFTWLLYTRPELAPFDYYMRVDCDSVHFSSPLVDPFVAMRDQNATFAFLRKAADPPCVYVGLYEAVGEYVAQKGLRPQAIPANQMVYNGFVGVGALSFFRSREYLEFAEYLNDVKRGVFTARWSDQQIYPIALALFRPPSAVRQWQSQAKDGTPTGYPVATHIHGKFWKRLKIELVREFDNVTTSLQALQTKGSSAHSTTPAAHTMATAIEWISRFQNPESCRGSRYMAFRYRKVGLGSEMHSMSVALSFALRTGRILVVDSSSWPELLQGCSDQSHTCFFKPLTSKCRPAAAEINRSETFSPRRLDQQLHRTLIFDLKEAIGHLKYKYTFVPPDVPKQRNRMLWYRSVLLAYILRPTSSTESAVAEKWRALFGAKTIAANSGSVVAVHIRRTDGTQTGVTRLDLTHFVRTAQYLIQGLPVKDLLIVTDEFSVVEMIRALPEAMNLSITSLGEDFRQNTDSRNKILSYNDGTRDPKHDYFSAVLDILLAAKCDYFVGQLSSNFSRLILELLFARLGEKALLNSVSLDQDWFVNP